MKKIVAFLTLILLLPSTETISAAEKPISAPALYRGGRNSESHHQAQSLLNKTIFQKTIYKYNEPSDLIELIPFVRDINDLIPRRFSLVNHQFLLNANEVVIQHHFHDARSRTAPKNSIIALEYTGDIGRSLDTRVEVPLFYSPLLGFSDWYRYPVGNYTMRITESNFSIREGLYIKARTRF